MMPIKYLSKGWLLILLPITLLCSNCASIYILNNNTDQYQFVKFIYTPVSLDSNYYYEKLVRLERDGYLKNIEIFKQDSSFGFSFLFAPESRLNLNHFLWFYTKTGQEERLLCFTDIAGKLACYKVMDNNFYALKQIATSKGAVFKWLGRAQYYVYLKRE
jgi:hypothetical protein